LFLIGLSGYVLMGRSAIVRLAREARRAAQTQRITDHHFDMMTGEPERGSHFARQLEKSRMREFPVSHFCRRCGAGTLIDIVFDRRRILGIDRAPSFYFALQQLFAFSGVESV